MILIFGGTTEGRHSVETLDEAGKPFYYSTRSAGQHIEGLHVIHRVGAMQQADMVRFCRENGIRLLVDAAHPFAENVHKNVEATATELHLPVVRYERQYLPHSSEWVWCADFNDAIVQLERRGISRLLALTGVQTIAKMRPYWTHYDCWFRILHRPESVNQALAQGFPEERLLFYPDNRLENIRPQAILTKESGLSGGFAEKVAEAKKTGIPLFVVQRPPLPDSFLVVNGPNGLRLRVQELLPDFFDLHIGLTTGCCATAATLAAFRQQKRVSVRLPNGEDIAVEAAKIGQKGTSPTVRTASVVKKAGDDPDITNGLEIEASVSLTPSSTPRIDIKGGEGVGRVTLPGLGLPIGAAAINEGPQQMIKENLLPLLPQGMSAEVTISVPQGREVGERTFNPHIGVIGGISIIGTSGIVKPFSAEAWISSIRKEMAVGLAVSAENSPQIVINSGAKSEKQLHQHWPALPPQAFVHYGNFIGETLQTASDLGVKRLAMGLMIGKAVKLAEGKLNTHSQQATMNLDFIRQMALEAGLDIKPIVRLNMARELWSLYSPAEMERLCHVIITHCHAVCDPLLPHGTLQIVLISDKGTIYQ